MSQNEVPTNDQPSPRALVRSFSCSALNRLELDKDSALVFVGEAGHAFTVKRSLLTRSSKFFKNALNGDFIEKSGIIKLLDGDADAFKLYIPWLQTSKIGIDTEEDWEDVQDLLIKCLMLADFIQDDAFYNATVDCIIDDMNSTHLYPTGMAAVLYESLPQTSPILKLSVDIWVHKAGPSWWEGKCSDLKDGPVNFWAAVAKESILMRWWEQSPKEHWKTNRCRYHKHEENSSCKTVKVELARKN